MQDCQKAARFSVFRGNPCRFFLRKLRASASALDLKLSIVRLKNKKTRYFQIKKCEEESLLYSQLYTKGVQLTMQ